MEEKFCKQCGAPLEDGATQCRYCRTPVAGAGQVPQQPYVQNNASQNHTTDDVASHKIYAILAYFGILVLVPIFAAPKSAFARFHANQGLVLFLVEVILTVASLFLGDIWLFALVIGVGRLLCFVLMIMGIVAAVQGEEKELPLIGGIKLLQ